MSVSDLLNLDDVKENVPRLTKLQYVQRPPDKTVSGASFEDSDITFQFTVSGNQWWIPSKTFFATRLKLGKDVAAAQPEMKDYVAPAPMFMSGLFSAVDFRIANKSIGRIGSNMAQIEAVRKRLTKTKAWRESAGRSNFFEDDFTSRQEAIATDTSITTTADLGFDPVNTLAMTVNGVITVAQNGGGAPPDVRGLFVEGDFIDITIGGVTTRYTVLSVPNATTINLVGAVGTFPLIGATEVGTTVIQKIRPAIGVRRNNLETMWQPPHAIFDVSTPQPPGTYSFVLSPNIGNKGAASIQTAPGVTWTGADVIVERMLLYIAVVDGETPPTDYTHYLDLTHVNCQPQTMRPTEGEQLFDYVVSPSTYALTLASQQSSAGKNTQYPGQLMKQVNDEHLSINRYRIQYAGQTMNSPDSDPTYAVDKNWMLKEWTDTMINSNLWFSAGGCEEFEAWLSGYGPIYHKTILKPSGDQSTQANVAITYSTAPSSGNLLLFDWSRIVAKIDYKDGRLYNVQTESA